MAQVKGRSGERMSRREQAAATRQRILEAAGALLSQRGYAGTTMQAIADEAGVAVQTVYFVFHTKGELLRQLLLSVGAGADQAMEMMDRQWVGEALSTSDGRRTIALMVEHGTDIGQRLEPTWDAMSQGAAVEPEVAEVLQGLLEQRRQGMRRLVELLEAGGHLREGLSVDRATDVIFGLHRPETLAVFVGEGGWSVSEYKAWLYDLLCGQLLDPERSEQDPDPTHDLSFG